MLFAIILSRGLVCWFSIKTIFLRYEILSKASGKLLAKIVFCSESAFFWTIFEFLQNWVNSYGERFLRGFCTRGNPLITVCIFDIHEFLRLRCRYPRERSQSRCVRDSRGNSSRIPRPEKHPCLATSTPQLRAKRL